MNAGCYGTETKDRMVELRAVTREGEIITLSNADMAYRYRKSNGPRGAVFVSATYEGFAGQPDEILSRMRKSPKSARVRSPPRPRPVARRSRTPRGIRAGS